MRDHKTHYYQTFRDSTFVVKIGGEVIFNAQKLENLVVDIALLHTHDIRIIVVHGGGTQADKMSKLLGFEPVKINGRRVTTEKDMEVVQMLYGGKLNLQILSIFKKLGLKGMRVCGMDANLLEAKKRPVKEVDYGLVGDILNVDPSILLYLTSQHIIPVVSPIAADKSGQILNINADTIAYHIASKIQADKLIYFTGTNGILNNNQQTISYLTPSEATRLIANGTITNGMAIKTLTAIKAVEENVKRVHMLNGLAEHSLLLEVLSTEGSGTMLCSEMERKKYLTELT